MKEAILEVIERAKQNVNEDYKEEYNCKLCQDVGVIVMKDGTGKICSCKNKQRELLKLQKAGINISGRLKNFKTDIYTDTNYMEMIKDILKDFVKDNQGKNLFLTGNTGLGKTYASQLVAIELIMKGKSVLYRKSNKLLDNLMGLKIEDMQEYETEQEALENIEVLVLDDLGTEILSESKLTELFNLIDERITKNKSTIISSNLSLEDIETKYNERIASRIKGYYQILEFKGKDLRYE